MRALLAALALALAASPPALAAPADGELVESRPCPPRTQPYDEWVANQVKGEAEEVALAKQAGVTAPAAEGLAKVLVSRTQYEAELKAPAACDFVYYGSDGLKVAAYIWKPATIAPNARLPVIVMLRGGNNDFGKWGPNGHRRMAALTGAGFIVIGVQYRGVDGGEGREEFGGADVHDVLNALKLARSLPQADPKNVFLHGGSRGGMMVYLALRDGAQVNAAVVLNGLADLESEAKRRPDLVVRVWSRLMPGYAERGPELLRGRSAVNFIGQVKTPPILLLHGSADWRADPDNSTRIAEILKANGRPHDIHIFKDDVHGLPWSWRERDRLTIEWFRRHMRR